ncbi:hypothetical protein MW887_010335 [Aspergillus wentii]|nr:hypothetical protein MW887_010335 [Aspergillus wentii]
MSSRNISVSKSLISGASTDYVSDILRGGKIAAKSLGTSEGFPNELEFNNHRFGLSVCVICVHRLAFESFLV